MQGASRPSRGCLEIFGFTWGHRCERAHRSRLSKVSSNEPGVHRPDGASTPPHLAVACFLCYVNVMARPLNVDRDAVASGTLTLRLTTGDRATLDALVSTAAAKLEESGIQLTAAAYVRGLIRREANQAREARERAANDARRAANDAREAREALEARERADDETRGFMGPRPGWATKLAPLEEPIDREVRELLIRVITALGKGAQRQIAAAAQLTQDEISSFKLNRKGMTDAKFYRLKAALESLSS